MSKVKSSENSLIASVNNETRRVAPQQQSVLDKQPAIFTPKQVLEELNLNPKAKTTLLSTSSTSSASSNSNSNTNSSSLSSNSSSTSSTQPANKITETHIIPEEQIKSQSNQDDLESSTPLINTNKLKLEITERPYYSSTPSSGASCASASSAIADLSVLSFSSSNSTSSLSSSVSYGDATNVLGLNSNESLNTSHFNKKSPIIFPKKQFINNLSFNKNKSKNSLENVSHKSTPLKTNDSSLTASELSELLAPYKNKPFYGKEWFYTKLSEYVNNKKLIKECSSASTSSSCISEYLLPQSSSSLALSTSSSSKSNSCCLVLLGDSGTGKTHLCCELKWPTLIKNEQSNQNKLSSNSLLTLSNQISSVYFFNLLNPKQNYLDRFSMFLTSSIRELASRLTHKQNDTTSPYKRLNKLKLNDYVFVESFTENDDEFLTGNEENFINPSYCEEYVNKLAHKFIETVLKPIKSNDKLNKELEKEDESNNTEATEAKKHKNYFILVDGIDDALLQAQRLLPNNSKSYSINQKFPFKFKSQGYVSKSCYSQAEMTLMFLNKVFSQFPSWLHLILTSKRCTEKKYLRKYLNNLKYDKLCMDKCVNINALINSNNQISKIVNQSASVSASTSVSENFNEIQNEEEIYPRLNTQNTVLTSLSSHSITNTNKSSTKLNRLSTPVEICNAAHFANLKDVQTYILKRLDTDPKLKSKFSKQDSSIEMLNLLLIKSNYCLLYVEKIFDLITNNVINSSEIKEIPVTLNGLYLYLIERLLNNLDEKQKQPTKKDLLYSIFGLGLIEFEPFGKLCVFNKLKSRFLSLNYEYFEYLFDYITPILFTQNHVNSRINSNNSYTSHEKTYTLFHSSFIDWLSDVKFCTLKYLANLNEAHFTLTNHYFNELLVNKYKKNSNSQFDDVKLIETTSSKPNYTITLWHKFKYHLFNSINLMTDAQLNYYFMLCESDYEHKILLNTLDRKLLQCKKLLKLDQDLNESCNSANSTTTLTGSKSRNEETNLNSSYLFNNEAKRMFDSTKMDYEAIFSMFELNQFKIEQENAQVEHALFDLITRSDLVTTKMLLKNDIRLRSIINTMTDLYNQTALIVAVKLNNYEFFEYLIQIKPINLDHCDKSGWTALRYSAWIGNENIVKSLLKNGAFVDACDTEGRTALRAAVFSGHEHIVKLLIEYGANVNKCDTDNRSVLHVAVYMGHVGLVNYLLLNGAFVNHQDTLGRGMLATNVFSTSANPRSQLDIAKVLIKYGARVDQCDNNNQTPLILASLNNSMHIVDLLLSYGADIDAIDNECFTALTYAIKNQFCDLAEFLLQKNAATHILDKEGRSILSIACSIGAERIVKQLMDKGLDEMHRDNFGWTPLHEIAYSGHLHLAEMLLNYGSEIDASDNEGKTSLFFACQEGHLEMVKLLVNRNANINARSHEGVSPFRVACMQNRFQICEFLLERNAEINYKDPDGRSTLYCLVCANKSFDMIKFLLDHGANNSKDVEGRSCLHVAAMIGSEESVSLLLKHKANKESFDSNANTPLLSACWGDKLNTVKLLLNENAKINHCNKQGATALSIASQKGNYEIVNELLQRGADIYASSRNPIKLAHRGGFTEVVKLIQIWSTMGYASNRNNSNSPNKQGTISSSTSVSVPRNSKSVDSFRNKNKSMNEKSIMQNINDRTAITPNSFSNYMMVNQSMQSYQVSSSNGVMLATPNTFETKYGHKIDFLSPYTNRSLLINPNEFHDKLNDPSGSNSLNYNRNIKLDEAKTSRFKQVKNKLLRKSTFIASSTERSSTILSSASNLYSNQSSQQVQTPGSKSVNSFRVFISSFNKSNNCDLNSSMGKLSKRESTLVKTLDQDDYLNSTEASNTLSSKSKNGSIMNMLRKKFKFLKNTNHSIDKKLDDEANDNIESKTRQMQRSNTDILTYNHVNKQDSLKIQSENSNSMNTLTKQDDETSTLNSKKIENDDVAHILNRNSLSDCLNPRRSFRDINNNLDVTTQALQYKRPTCLQLNYFKKETSI